jgi:hydrogenase/urease accessory protein HupE
VLSVILAGLRRAALVVACLLASGPAAAHPAPYSYVDLRLTATGLEGSLILHDFDIAHDFGIDPPERLRDAGLVESLRPSIERLMDGRIVLLLDASRATLTWTGIEPLPERQSVRLSFRTGSTRPARVRLTAVVFPYDAIHQTFINVYEDGTLRHQAILSTARTDMEYYAGTWQGASAVMAVFVPAGVEHILIGPDHVLFLVGLLLLGGSLWTLTAIVTAFTVGHSITLSLAALDVVSPPASIVEPLIALSIVFVGADNLLVQRDRREAAAAGRRPRDIRAWVAGVFGLIHGFGFASVLKEFGLPSTALGWSLFSFNVGVEIGQLAIVLVVARVLATVHARNAEVGRRLVLAGSLIVIVAGSYWFVQRVFLTPG